MHERSDRHPSNVIVSEELKTESQFSHTFYGRMEFVRTLTQSENDLLRQKGWEVHGFKFVVKEVEGDDRS